MSVLQYPIDVPDVQIWNNAAFDTDDSISSSSSKHLDSSSTKEKENLCPSLCTPSVCRNSQTPIKPTNSQGKPFKVLFKQGLLSPTHEALLGDRNIDAEIEAIESEISRLSLKLRSLRLEKEDKSVTGSFKVPEQKQASKGVSFLSRKMEATPEVNNGVKPKRKGLSMGPWEIAAAVPLQKGKQERTLTQSGKGPRGISLGPSEIAAGIRSHKGRQEVAPIQPEKTARAMSIGPSEIVGGGRFLKRGKQELTPILSSQKSRRKSCFFKLQNVDEEKVTKGTRGRTLSLSPKSQSNALIQSSKQRFATIGSNKIGKKDDHILSNIQPKNLFKEEDMSAASKRLYKSGRVVGSRYSQCSASQRQNDPRKMSLPGNDRNENLKRPSSVETARLFLLDSGSNQGSESKLEVSSRAVNFTHNSSPPTLKVGELLPKLRIFPSRFESPRDSGPAKKVADLVGRMSYFAEEETSMEASVCQTLRFDEEEEE